MGSSIITVTCKDCGKDREVQKQPYNTSPERCQDCHRKHQRKIREQHFIAKRSLK